MTSEGREAELVEQLNLGTAPSMNGNTSVNAAIAVDGHKKSLPAAALEEVLARAGAPRRPEDLQWPRAFYRDAVRHAREIRDRYTFLDLATDSGMLET